jgi:hypothetical protein
MGARDLEWNLILDLWREHQRQHAPKRVTLNGPLLSQFFLRVEQEETFQLSHQREDEEQALGRTCLQRDSEPRSSHEVLPEMTIDLTQLRHLEEDR